MLPRATEFLLTFRARATNSHKYFFFFFRWDEFEKPLTKRLAHAAQFHVINIFYTFARSHSKLECHSESFNAFHIFVMAKVEGVELKLMSLEDFTALDESSRPYELSWAYKIFSFRRWFQYHATTLTCQFYSLIEFFSILRFPTVDFFIFMMLFMCDAEAGVGSVRVEYAAVVRKLRIFCWIISFRIFDFFRYYGFELEAKSERVRTSRCRVKVN